MPLYKPYKNAPATITQNLMIKKSTNVIYNFRIKSNFNIAHN